MKYSKKKRRCKNGHESFIYAWDDDKCKCGEVMKEVKPEKKNLIGIRTPTKNRI